MQSPTRYSSAPAGATAICRDHIASAEVEEEHVHITEAYLDGYKYAEKW